MTVLNLLKNRAGASWVFLVAATVVSWACLLYTSDAADE